MELEIQKYFRNTLTPFESKIEHLKNDLNMNVKVQDNKILLNYRVDSPKDNPITNECRGLILDTMNYDVVCFPFRRFYNHGEGYAAKIDWSTATVQEKIDGSLMNIYFDYPFSNEWKVSTRNMIYAEGPIFENKIMGTSPKTFAQLFWEIMIKKIFSVDKILNSHIWTYSFEMVSLQTKVVKEYKESDLYLLSIRNNRNGDELINPELIANQSGFLRPKVYQLSNNSLEQILEIMKELQPDDEGYVVVDKYYNRIKVKNPAYFAVAALKSNGNPLTNLVSFVIKGERDEILSYFPEFESQYNKVERIYNDMLFCAQELYLELKDNPSQKEFALGIVGKTPLSALLFQIRQGRYLTLTDAARANPDLIEKAIINGLEKV